MAKRGPRLPDLPQEARLKAAPDASKRGSISLYGDLKCDHYYLRDGFFDLRLHQMLAEVSPGGTLEPADRRDGLNAIEDEVIEADRKRGQKELEEDRLQMEAYKKQLLENSHDDSYFHFLSLFIGLVLGTLAVLYGREVSYGCVDLYQRVIRRQSSGHANEHLQGLVLPSAMDTMDQL